MHNQDCDLNIDHLKGKVLFLMSSDLDSDLCQLGAEGGSLLYTDDYHSPEKLGTKPRRCLILLSTPAVPGPGSVRCCHCALLFVVAILGTN